MLVLSRKVGETIYIDGQIKVTVIKISGNRVQVGIDAPDQMRIVRSELNEWDESSFGQPVPHEVDSVRCCPALP